VARTDDRGARVFGFGVKTISIEQLAARMSEGDPLVIDVREPSEFAAGHVPGARNIPLAQLAARAQKLDPAAETLLICQSGHRSARAAKQLKRAGFEHAFTVKGGTQAWKGPLKR